MDTSPKAWALAWACAHPFDRAHRNFNPPLKGDFPIRPGTPAAIRKHATTKAFVSNRTANYFDVVGNEI